MVAGTPARVLAESIIEALDFLDTSGLAPTEAVDVLIDHLGDRAEREAVVAVEAPASGWEAFKEYCAAENQEQEIKPRPPSRRTSLAWDRAMKEAEVRDFAERRARIAELKAR